MSTTKTVLERIALALEALVAARERAEVFNLKTHNEMTARITEFQAAYTEQMQTLLARQAEYEAEQDRRYRAFTGEPRQPAVLYDITDGKPNKDKD